MTMKKFVAILILGCVAMLAYAGSDANQLFYVSLLPVQTVSATSVTGTAVDVSSYKGNAAFVFSTGASTVNGYTGVVTVTHCATSGGTYITVTNLAGTALVVTKTSTNSAAVNTVACDLARLHKYVKVVAAVANDTNEVAVVLVAPMQAQ